MTSELIESLDGDLKSFLGAFKEYLQDQSFAMHVLPEAEMKALFEKLNQENLTKPQFQQYCETATFQNSPDRQETGKTFGSIAMMFLDNYLTGQEEEE